VSRYWIGSAGRDLAETGAASLRPTKSGYSMRIGNDWQLTCHTYSDRSPIFVLVAGDTELTITARRGMVTADAVDFAYSLVSAANEFLLATERMFDATIGLDGDAA
jgi:hypothetical protein